MPQPDDIDGIIKTALQVRLTKEESAVLKQNLTNFVRDSSPAQELAASEHSAQTQSFLSSAGELSLSGKEKSAMRAELMSFMQNNTPRMEEAEPVTIGGMWSAFSFLLKVPVVACLMLFLGMGGVAYAAQTALPGATLYPIKIHVLEAVAAQVALSAESRAQLQADLAIERLREARLLLSNGTLSESASTSVNENFTMHVSRMRLNLQEMNSRNEQSAAQQIEVRFAQSAAEQADALATDARKSSDTPAVTRNLLPNVEVAVLQSLQTEADFEASATATSSSESSDENAEFLRKTAAKRVWTVRSYLRDHGKTLKPQSAEKANARLEAAEADLDKAGKLTHGGSAEGAGLLKTSLKATQEAAVLLQDKDEETIQSPTTTPASSSAGQSSSQPKSASSSSESSAGATSSSSSTQGAASSSSTAQSSAGASSAGASSSALSSSIAMVPSSSSSAASAVEKVIDPVKKLIP